MECTVKWVGAAGSGTAGMSFVAETGSGHALVMDGAPEGAAAIWAATDGDGVAGHRWLHRL
jgi:hypothetical protein